VRGFFSETGPLRDEGTFTPEKRKDFKMKLYHFTASEYIEPIMTHGLNRGEVVIDAPNLVQNGVNLTTDDDPRDHGLSDGRLVTSLERRIFEQMDGVRLPKGMRFPDKRRVRIEIDLPEHTHGLVNWIQWSATHVDRATREGLIRGRVPQRGVAAGVHRQPPGRFGLRTQTLHREIPDDRRGDEPVLGAGEEP
jgi:hypothetical protein